MGFRSNQFAQTDLQGRVDLAGGKHCLAVMVDDSYNGAPLVPGQAVKLVDQISSLPHITASTSDADQIDGFVCLNPRKNESSSGDVVEMITGKDGYMTMTASAAIPVNSPVMIVFATKKIAVATTGKRVVGRALDKALADGDIIRVAVELPAPLQA